MASVIRIHGNDYDSALLWCADHAIGIWSSSMVTGGFVFEDDQDAMAFRLRFDEVRTVMIIDPPSGWKYGFPRPLTIRDGQSLEEWLIENGYPREFAESDLVKHCRYWEMEL